MPRLGRMSCEYCFAEGCLLGVPCTLNVGRSEVLRLVYAENPILAYDATQL